MKIVIGALALALVSSGVNAATYSFDLLDFSTSALVGSGTLSFADHAVSAATTNTSGRAIYNPVPFTITASIVGKPDILWTVGGAYVNYAFVPPGGPCCNPPPTPDSIALIGSDGARFAYGDLTVSGSVTALQSGDFSRANFNSLLATMTFARFNPGDNVLRSAVNFRELAAPVPEAGEWAMLLGGLGIVGAAADRRKRAT